MVPSESKYAAAANIASSIKAELRHLKLWDDYPLPPEKLDNMGAFGSNTMAFTEWIQFILLPRIYEIVEEKGDFPSESMIAAYAIRELDGHPNPGRLHDLLYELDALINKVNDGITHEETGTPSTVSLGDTKIPDVLYTLASVLPQFAGEDLESQLQTFKMFAGILSPLTKPEISQMLMTASLSAANPESAVRIQEVAKAIRGSDSK